MEKEQQRKAQYDTKHEVAQEVDPEEIVPKLSDCEFAIRRFMDCLMDEPMRWDAAVNKNEGVHLRVRAGCPWLVFRNFYFYRRQVRRGSLLGYGGTANLNRFASSEHWKKMLKFMVEQKIAVYSNDGKAVILLKGTHIAN